MQSPKTVIVILSALALAILSGCSKKDDTTAIRQLIGEGTQLAEDHQIGGLMRLTTPDFIALPGQHDASQVKGILFMAFQHYGKLKIHHPRPSVEVAEGGKAATALIHFVIVSQDKAIPDLRALYEDPERWIEKASEKADLYQLELELVKEDGDWRVKIAEMKGFKGWGF